jgi:DNA-binding transcriptional ArsR family regulator
MVRKLTIISILEPFLYRPKEKLHLAEISRKTKEPHPTARQWLNLLEKKGVLRKQHKGRLTMYSLNLDSRNLLGYLVIAEKSKMIRKCEKELLLKELNNFVQTTIKSDVLVFGSAVDSLRSANDIDLLVVGKSEDAAIKNFSKKINKEIHIINVKKFELVSKSLKEEIIRKHLILKGSENALGWMIW